MLPDYLSLGKLTRQAFTSLPSFRFRDKDATTHNASDATKCGRQLTYKALKTKESNPTDFLGMVRMRFGSWIEQGLKHDVFSRIGVFGCFSLSTQGDAGEHGTFYGTSWHGYRDFDLGFKQLEGKIKPVIVELKTKVGYGAQVTIKETAWSKNYKTPTPDTEWGYSQQLALYLRDAYLKTKDNPNFTNPITDGILLQFLYADGLACLVEYFFEYDPEEDTATCYRVHCAEYPEVDANINLKIKLKDIADRWNSQDRYLAKKELAPPDYERKYAVDDPRIEDATKKDLGLAVKNQLLIGDIKCKYCAYKNKCAEDLGIPPQYTNEEIIALKKVLKNL